MLIVEVYNKQTDENEYLYVEQIEDIDETKYIIIEAWEE